jgi:hypothetical protein
VSFLRVGETDSVVSAGLKTDALSWSLRMHLAVGDLLVAVVGRLVLGGSEPEPLPSL